MTRETTNNINKVSQEVKEIIENLFQKATFQAEDISVYFNEENNELWGCITSSEPKFLIGRAGENLIALNHVIKKIIRKQLFPEGELPINIIIDVNEYQKKKIDNLKTMAHMMAERARFFKSNIEIDPMSSYDRRIIHEFLADTQDLETESTGEGRSRRIVIKYVG